MKVENTEMEKAEYILMDSKNTLLLHVLMESTPGDEILTLRLANPTSKPPDVMRYNKLQLVNADWEKGIQCCPVQQSGDQIQVKRDSTAYFDLRSDLRVPVRFISFLYPVGTGWTGRQEIQAVDLSCGGLAFSSDTGLTKGEKVELVLPVTDEPLVVHCELVRVQELDEKTSLYSAKFVDLCGAEESMVRKAVFDIQLKNRRQDGV